MWSRVPQPLMNLTFLLLALVALWMIGEFSNSVNTTGEGEVGYIVSYEGSIYFIQGEHIQQPDIENFSYEDHSMGENAIVFSRYANRFESVSMLDNPSKLLMKNIKNGDKVRIWYSQVFESYPAKIKVQHIEKF
ncbi:DUF3221 domain-containing protein [Lysinibacillus sp. FSL H8-0500]|uniref:DUF3221 domain-containing protein n=1 Tax=Lysinibacillus macroides TaxID=33935 RepID=A0A0M9DNI6_9BACI|nr:DUF3221 domain-containing protein [Lysinibacillus macroides]KOY84000.1 hypothetical protein ADM90_00895 [Lysinibacillus macroides]QPR66769.1 DUF3221 domain-containing protein [Lysinibacillus macroides]